MTTALTSSLTIHPAAALIPAPGADDSTLATLTHSVADLGVLVALKVCKGRVVDGRARLAAAKAAGLDEVPTEEVAEGDAASIVLHSLAARRHLTKSAIAYLALPWLDVALAESRRRRVENLKIGVNHSKPRSCAQRTIGNTEELAEQFGVGRRMIFEAREIAKKFAAHPAVRAEWEPKILSGEMGLGQVQQAIAGKIASIDGRTTPKNDAGQLMLALFDTAEVRFERWSKLEPGERSRAVEKFRTKFLPNLPEELLEEAEHFLASRKATA